MAVKPPSGTKTAIAYNAIREQIESGKRAPGSRLLVDELRSDLGMSPTPIREALRLLEAEGLVTNRPHKGAEVSVHDAASAEEIYWFRALLEPIATARAARFRSDEDAHELSKLHGRMVDAIGSHSIETVDLNAEWHRFLYGLARAPSLQALINQLWASLPVDAMWLSTRAEESIAEHGAILASVLEGDAERAANLMRRHILAGADRALIRYRSDGDGQKPSSSGLKDGLWDIESAISF